MAGNVQHIFAQCRTSYNTEWVYFNTVKHMHVQVVNSKINNLLFEHFRAHPNIIKQEDRFD